MITQSVQSPVVELDDERNLEQTARFFDVSVPTVRAWIEDGCPVVERGSNGVGYKLSLRAVKGWRDGRRENEERETEQRLLADAQLRLELLGGDMLGGPAMATLSPKQQADALAAELAKIKLARERRELVRADDMQFEITRTFAAIADKIRLWPDQLAAELAWSEDQRAAFADHVDDLLDSLGDDIASLEPAKVADASL